MSQTATAIDQPAPAPIRAGERIKSIDVLRGFALLGILVMNIPTFAFLPSAFFQPEDSTGGLEGANYFAWLFNHLFFEMKMMTLFSVLFGAGIVVFTTRAARRSPKIGGLYYRRMFVLLLLGLFHAYVIWEGDILFLYAICGMILFPFRNWNPKKLIILGLVFLFIAIPINVGSGFFFKQARSEAAPLVAAEQAGEELTEEQSEKLEIWQGIARDFAPDEERKEDWRAQFNGSYLDLFEYRADASFWMQTQLVLIWGLWRAGGAMLLGMALLKLGFLSGERSTRTYLNCMLLGYGVGIPLVALGVQFFRAHNWDFVDMFITDWWFNYVGSLFVALGHASLILLVCRFRVLPRLAAALAAVGRMALTNYLMQSIICAVIFYGYGLGYFERVDRVGLLGIVLIIWAVQLIVSPLWLARFRFGPAEWLWRSLTYGRAQPMRYRALEDQ